MALDGKVAAALALHRFGLGPSLGSRAGAISAIESDPRGAVLAGLDRPNAGRIVTADLLNSGEAARSAIAFQQAQRELRREARKTAPKLADQNQDPAGGTAAAPPAPRNRALAAKSDMRAAAGIAPQQIYLTEAKARFTAALDADVGNALIAEMERDIPGNSGLLKSRIEDNRRHLREHGYVVGCGTWSPHINGCAVPIWSPQYQTFVVATIGLLSAMFDEKRLHKEAAPQMLQLGAALGSLLEGAEGDIFTNRIERKPLPVPTHNNNKIIKTEDTNELEAGARRARSARSVRARDGRR
jgi:hypothetical protein